MASTAIQICPHVLFAVEGRQIPILAEPLEKFGLAHDKRYIFKTGDE